LHVVDEVADKIVIL